MGQGLEGGSPAFPTNKRKLTRLTSPRTWVFTWPPLLLRWCLPV